MKVTVIIGQLERGGAETQLYYLLKHLPYSVTVISLSAGGYWAKPIRDLGHTVIEIERHKSLELRRFRELLKVLRQTKPDVIHVFLDGISGLYGRFGAMMQHPRVVVVGIRSHPTYFPKWYLRLLPILNHIVDYVVTNSDSAGDFMLQHKLVSPDKLSIINNGLDFEKFNQPDLENWENPLPPEWKRSKIIGTVGHLTPVKGPDIFVEVAVQIHADFPNTRFVYIGDGPKRAEIDSQIARYGAQNYVLLLGEREDIPQLLSQLDIFMLTSRSEGLSNALLEAMAASLPSVVTDAGDCGIHVRNSQSGFVSPIGDIADLVRNLTSLLQADRQKYSKNASNYAEKFSNSRMAKAYIDLYDS